MLVSSEIAIVFLGLIVVTITQPLDEGNEVQLLKYHDDRSADGSYDFNYELSDGQSRQEKGTFSDGKDANGNDIKVLSVTGSYSWIAPDGSEYEVFYIADERGFRIQKMSAVGSPVSDIKSNDDDEKNTTNNPDTELSIETTESSTQ